MSRIHTEYISCALCPRACAVDRTRDERGYCGMSSRVRVACAGLHMGEEPPISGTLGSGTVFFSGCTLQCAFCQNRQISHGAMGRDVSEAELAEILSRLEEAGAANINLVTGTQFTPGICSAVASARRAGLSIPVVWNGSGYETERTLGRLDELVDVYLPDLKTLDSGLAAELFRAPDYPETARRALQHMTRVRPAVFEEGEDGLMRRGTIVRHLVLPGRLESTREVLAWYAEHLAERSVLSVMFQYTPVEHGMPCRAPERRLTEEEYEQVLTWLEELGIDEGYVQSYETGSDWLPDFSQENPFSSELSRIIWHHGGGFTRAL